MKALVYTGTNEIKYQNEPLLNPSPGEAQIKIDAVGICGSDMHAYHGNDPRRVPPLILGHEAAGVVVDGEQIGKRVVINPLVSCDRCEDCYSGRSNLCKNRKLIGMNFPGAFADYVNIIEKNLITIPEGMSTTHAALTEPTATSLHSIHLAEKVLHRPVSEGRALVIGGGSIGLLAALILRSHGCNEILLCDTNDLRLKTALKTGCCKVFDPKNEPSNFENRFELVIDAVGMESTRNLAIRAVRPGGVLMHIGLQHGSGTCDFRKITLGEITVIGTYTYTHCDMQAALLAINSGDLGDFSWIDERPLSEGAMAFSDLNHGRSAAPKIVLHPNL